MSYRTFQCSQIGSRHHRNSLPRQDRTAVRESAGLLIAAVADGHGSRRHFRSEIGAETACITALEQISRMADSAGSLVLTDSSFALLMKQITDSWKEKILQHAARHPWTREEIAEQKSLLTEEQYLRFINNQDTLIPYGTTLCAVFSDRKQWGSIQIGDGSVTIVTDKGHYLWPMPPSKMNQGNKTASLCMNDPLSDFRYCSGQGKPGALLVYTDGIDKTLVPEGREIISFLHWVINNELTGKKNRNGNLSKTLGMITSRSNSGDDVSIAGILNTGITPATPRLTNKQAEKELVLIDTRILEISNTIRYNKERLNEIQPESEAALQLSDVITRKEQDIIRLQTVRQHLLEMMDKTNTVKSDE